MRATAVTGPLHHTLILSGSTFRRETGSVSTTFATVNSNLFNTTYIGKPSLSGLPDDPRTTAELRLSGVAIGDTISTLDNRIQLMFGVRFQNIKTDNFDVVTGARTSRYDRSAFSPGVGLVVKPWESVSLYANYIEGLSQGLTAGPGALNTGQIFEPFRSKQYETGVKADFGRFGTTLALFQITQPAGFFDPATLLFGILGEQRNRGIELNVFGIPASGTRVLGGVMLLDAELTKTQSGLNKGNTAIGAPKVNVNLGGEWDLPFFPALTLSSRVIYTSPQYLNAANTQEIPDWVRLDVGARYRMRAYDWPMTIRANIENVVGTNYWASAAGARLIPGIPRIFLLSATVDF